MWRRFAFLAAEVVNISGKSLRKGKVMKAEDFLRFDDDEAREKWTPAKIEARRQRAMETARLHKAKFWTKIKDESVRKVTEG